MQGVYGEYMGIAESQMQNQSRDDMETAMLFRV